MWPGATGPTYNDVFGKHPRGVIGATDAQKEHIMSNVLYIQASPRGERSKSIAVADAFLDAYRAAHPDDNVSTLNLFQADLMPFSGLALDAKYAILHGQEHTPEQLAAWRATEEIIAGFTWADKYVLAVPMWNFGIPYRLKQYLDIIVQPTYTFAYSPEDGYTGLLTGKRAFIAYARGGEYAAPEAAGFDHQKSYLDMILSFMGITDICSVVIEPTLMAGPQVAAEKLTAAISQAKQLAAEFQSVAV